MSRAIVIDCDPGHDDALALLLAIASPELEVLAVTAVAGNVPLALTSANALRLVELAGRPDIPVHAGCAQPLIRPLVTAEHVHGRTGLDGSGLPDPVAAAREEHAVDAIIRLLRERPPGTVTLCPLGPLTNLAMAFRKAPDVVARVGQIVLMGGAAGEGNVTPSAEFNVYVDPEAAAIVFGSGLPVTMCGLDVTHQALATPDVLGRLARLDTGLSRICVELLTYFASAYRRLWGFAAPPLHDPVAVARVIDPGIVRCVEANVVVELHGQYTRGATVVDLHRYLDRPVNARVAVELDVERFWDRVITAVDVLGGPAP